MPEHTDATPLHPDRCPPEGTRSSPGDQWPLDEEGREDPGVPAKSARAVGRRRTTYVAVQDEDPIDPEGRGDISELGQHPLARCRVRADEPCDNLVPEAHAADRRFAPRGTAAHQDDGTRRVGDHRRQIPGRGRLNQLTRGQRRSPHQR